MPNYRLSQHGLDIVFKLEAEQLGSALGRRFGIDLPPIVRHFPTELPVADVHLEQLDTVFELQDGSLLHLEFQTIHRRETLARFFQYDVNLYLQYKRDISTIVLYGAGIATAAETLDFHAVQYKVHNIFIGQQDGEATYQRLRARVEAQAGLAPEERLDLIFLPLMRQTKPALAVVSDALRLARQLPSEEQRQALASLIGLGQSFLDQAQLGVLLEGLMATSIGQSLLERGRITGKQEYLTKVLTRRFGIVPQDLASRLLDVGDEEQLDSLLDAAHSARDLDEFKALVI